MSENTFNVNKSKESEKPKDLKSNDPIKLSNKEQAILMLIDNIGSTKYFRSNLKVQIEEESDEEIIKTNWLNTNIYKEDGSLDEEQVQLRISEYELYSTE